MTATASISPRFADYRRHADELVGATIAAADPNAAVSRFLRREGRTLWVGRASEAEAIDLDRGRIYLVAAGKAAISMTTAAMAVLGADVAGGVVIAKVGGHEWPEVAGQWPLALHRGGHPLPEAGSLAGTKAVLELLAATRAEDAVLCLISGGASSLLTQPLLPLEDWRKLVEVFLKSGCTISELNAVRRAIDRIKAGGLARACAPASCYGLILSDVVGNPLPVIGGGPTVPDDDLVVGAVAVLGRYDIARQLEKAEWQRLALALNQARYLHKAARPSVRDLQAWIVEHPAEDLAVPALARRAAMSVRNFSRVFAAEIGVLRSTGMTRRQLWRLSLLETGLVGATAGLLAMPTGYVLALILIYIINLRSFGWTLEMRLQPEEFVQAFLVALLAALLAGLYPAWKMGQ
ncbi:MAG TPA: DUF4147 domain-containing protein, partial [Promineifilum sp.]|nr:DUF4147 domain-containing protein [Promineifilum sp.]